MKRILAGIALTALIAVTCTRGAQAEDGLDEPLLRFAVQQDEVPPPPGFQPPEAQPNEDTGTSPSDRTVDPTLAAQDTALRSAAARRRLARTPEMFGDFFGPTIILPIDDPTLVQSSAGPGGGVTKISDSNKAAIGCRTYLLYNHFHNAIQAELDLGGPLNELRKAHIDRFTLGLERPLGNTNWSAEFRVPIFVNLGTSFPGVSTFDAGELGNIAGIFKRELYRTEDAVLSAGLGVSLPTGDDVLAGGDNEFLLIRNEAVHLMPFIAVQRQWESWFLHGFVQADFDLNGNTVEGERTFFDSGVLNDQTLLFVDLGIGRWLYRNEYAPFVRGLAGMFEIHYETALQDADIVTLDIGLFPGPATLGNTINRFDVINVTGAIQVNIGQRSSLRVGASAPLTQPDNRFFDAEVAAQFIIRCHQQ